jgi:hypothetical protein
MPVKFPVMVIFSMARVNFVVFWVISDGKFGNLRLVGESWFFCAEGEGMPVLFKSPVFRQTVRVLS